MLGRLRRKLFGPKFYRPPVSDMAHPGGVVDRMMQRITADVRADARPSLESALAHADVVFTHDPFSAERALTARRGGQQVWMMCHAVTPMALYAAWSWALPEADWRDLLAYPDVRSWIEWELDIWSRVDRVILPCAEAADTFRPIDPRFADILDRAEYVLSGASAPPRTSSSGADLTRRGADPTTRGADLLGPRRSGERVGLYLGSPEPYRGFDALLGGVELLPPDVNLTIAVAGPDRSKVPTHPAFRALGRVEDVAALLASVDFLINVNRFSLFDLSTIEAAEAGKPLMLHAVGGNRAFDRIGAGCVMLRDLGPRVIAECLTTMARLEAAELAALGRKSRACWERELTPAHMWERHLALYDRFSAARV
jgi:glycosyltransferase involved in cell wall biosynthesis